MLEKFYAVKAFFLLSIISLMIGTCATMRDDVFISSDLAETVKPELGKIEQELLKQVSAYDKTEMEILYKKLDKLFSTPSSDEKYLARVKALMADYYIVNGNKRRARSFANEALKHNKLDEYAILVNAKCMKESEAVEYANTIFERFPHYYRLGAYLAHLYFKQKDYTSAIVAFDASLPFLDKAYLALYEEERAISYKRHSIATETEESSKAILAKEKILLIDMTKLTDENTDVLNVITGNSKWKSSRLADRLKSAGWYVANAMLETDYVKRSDAAIFLWHLICMSNESRLSSYSNKYKNRSRSPILDVAIGSEYFDASLAMVEKDIIPLIDGRYFSPESFVSGLDFYTYLKKAEDLRY